MLKNLSISRKMLLQAGCALALAAGLLANQFVLSSSVKTAMKETHLSHGVYETALRADLNIRQSLVVNRDILLSRNATELEAALAQIPVLRREGVALLDAARAAAVLADNKTRFEQARDLLPVYLSAVSEIGEIQRARFADERAQIAIATDWDRQMASLQASTMLANSPKRLEIETSLEHTDALIKAARNAMWRYETTLEKALLPVIGKNLAEAEQYLAKLKGPAADSTIREPVAALSLVIPRLRDVMGRMTKAKEQQSAILQNKATPTRQRITDLIEPTKVAALEKSKSVADAIESKLGLTMMVSLALTAFLAIILVAGAAFSIRFIAEPIRKVTEVLSALVKGDRSVAVPYQENGDEIGSLARAADAFKTTLIECEKLEGHQRSLTKQQESSAREIAAVVAAVSEVAQRTTRGDFSGSLDPAMAQGDLQQLVASMNAINRTMGEVILQMSSTLGKIASGDLTATVSTHYEGQFDELKNAINDTVDKLAQTIRTIQQTSISAGSAASEITLGANDLSKRTEEQAASLEETAAATEELAASVKGSAEAASKAAEMAKDAAAVATKGGVIVGNAVEAMTRIEEASRKINDITSVIEEIAFQTNLLALNASVEAARAGEAGKGFAVVASEVRTLAQRSSTAAKDISDLIAMAVQQVDGGVKLVRETGTILEGIIRASHQVDLTINNVATATVEQANGIDEMAQTVAHLDDMTQQNAALAEQSAAASTSMTETIARLNDLVATFRIEPVGEGQRHGHPAKIVHLSHVAATPRRIVNSRTG